MHRKLSKLLTNGTIQAYTIQKTLEIIEKIKNKNTKLKQIIIQPSQTFKTTIFVKNKERDNIYQNIIIPELNYTIEN